MSDSDNLSKRLIIRGKDLTKSYTGLSALLIFLTLLMLGIVFGLRFEPQPTYIIQETTSVDPDTQSASNQNINQSESQSDASPTQNENREFGQTNVFGDYMDTVDENIEITKSHVKQLKGIKEQQEIQQPQSDAPIISDSQVIELLDKQIDKREEIILQEEELVDDILEQTENGNLPESITNGHTQALIEEKSLEESMEEYEESLDSDTTLSENEKNKILNALLLTAENFNEEREDRRDRFRDAKNQLSNDDLSISAREELKALMESEDLEYSQELREQQMELDKMIGEEVTDQDVSSDSSNTYMLHKYQAEELAKDIESLQDELEEEQGVYFKPDSMVEDLLSRNSNLSSVEEEIDDSIYEIIDGLSDETSDEEKERLVAKNNKEKSKRRNLNNKKQKLVDRLSYSDNFVKEPMATSPENLVDKIDNVEQGLDLANQKIDLILDILSTDTLSEVSKRRGLQTQSNQDRQKSKNQDEDINFEDTQSNEPEKSEIINQPLFTRDQVNSENKERLDKQLEYERREFEDFTGVDALSGALKKKTKWFLSRATYRPDPTYPIEAEERSLEGDCLVSFQINPNGTTEDANANCTNDIFITPTERTLKKWEFIPNEYINPMLDVRYVLEK